MCTLINLIILRDGKELEEGTDFIAHWNSMEIEVFNPDHESTYQLIIYVNNNLFTNERIEHVEHDWTDKPNIQL